MVKANYNFRIIGKVISICDENQGGMSVTNDMENVLKDIEQRRNIKAIDYKVIYEDSEGVWDAYDVRKQEFVMLGCSREKDALEELKKRI